jgi:hypothetical protein
MDRSPKERFSALSHDATVQEIAQEKANSLGRAGRRLAAAIEALESHDLAAADSAVRRGLVDEAGEALFFYLVQREACGLHDSEEILRDYRVPYEVQLRMRPRRRG